MDKVRWNRPLLQIQLMAGGGAMALVVVLALVLGGTSGSWGTGSLLLLVLLPVMLLVIVLVVMRWREVSASISMGVQAPPERVIAILARALKKAGLDYDLGSSRMDPSYGVRWKEVFHLEKGLRLNILDSRGRTVIFLGPVRPDNRAEAERLKGVCESIVGKA